MAPRRAAPRGGRRRVDRTKRLVTFTPSNAKCPGPFLCFSVLRVFNSITPQDRLDDDRPRSQLSNGRRPRNNLQADNRQRGLTVYRDRHVALRNQRKALSQAHLTENAFDAPQRCPNTPVLDRSIRPQMQPPTLRRRVGCFRLDQLRAVCLANILTKLVYQAQTDDPALTEKARACADRLGLAFERRFTGYGDLETALSRV